MDSLQQKITQQESYHSVLQLLKAASQEEQWHSLIENGQQLLLMRDVPTEIRAQARAAVSHGYYRWNEEAELRSLSYDHILEQLDRDSVGLNDQADYYWLRSLLIHKHAVYGRRGDWHTALENVARAIELEPFRSEYFLHRAIVNAHHDRDYTRAILDAKRAIELGSTTVDYLDCLANTYYHAVRVGHPLGDLRKAIAYYTQAIELESDWAHLYWQRGQVLHELGQEETAIEDENRACGINPLFTAFQYAERAVFKVITNKDTGSAIADADRAILLDPKNAHHYDARARVYAMLKPEKYSQAIQDHNKAVQLEPAEAKWRLARGDTLMTLGELDRALDDYNRAVELTPHLAEAYSRRAECLEHRKETDLAIADYSRAIEINPNPSYFQRRAKA